MRRVLLFIVGIVVLIVVAVGSATAGYLVGAQDPLGISGPSRTGDQPETFDVFWQAWTIVHRNFVDREALDDTALTYGAIRGMVQALGDEGHTAFLTPEERERQQADLSGKFSGIGAQLGIRESLPVIVAPFDGSPAANAGVKAGDIIIRVDGEDVTTLPLNDIVSMIRGPEGTTVTLSLLRPGENRSLEVSIVRGEITVPAATWAMIPGTDVALIRLSQFSANATENIVAAVNGARAENARALIVDVRNNPGGLLEQAIRVTSQFLTSGNVLLQEDAEGNREMFAVEPGGVATDLPLIVLINPGSASSAEIFSGAIQDHKRGTLVGETTFGTGTVLRPFELADGSTLLLGTQQWLTPNGRLIRKQGIEPDVKLPLPIETALLSPGEIREMSPDEINEHPDLQLRKALELLEAGPPVPTPEVTPTP